MDGVIRFPRLLVASLILASHSCLGQASDPSRPDGSPQSAHSMLDQFAHHGRQFVETRKKRNISTSLQCVAWVARAEDHLAFHGTTVGDSLVSKVIFDSAFQDAGSRILLLATAPVDYDCQACVPSVGLIFQEKTSIHIEHNIGTLGENGVLSRPNPVLLTSADEYVFVFVDGQVGQGFFQESATLIRYAPPTSVRFSTVHLGSNDSGACGSDSRPCWGYNATIDWRSSNFPSKIRLIRKGTIQGDSGPVRSVADSTVELKWRDSL